MKLDREGYDDGWGYSSQIDAWIHEESGVYYRRPPGMEATAEGLALTRGRQEATGKLSVDGNHLEMTCSDGLPDPIDDASLSLEDLRWKKFGVLDDGFVCLVDWMGTDDAIVQAARVSYGKDKRDGDEQGGVRKLLRMMMRLHHTSPFEMCEVKLLVRCPMDVWRQWIRHRTANVNEYSTRYTPAIDSAQRTPDDLWRSQSTANKQGSEGFLHEWPEGWSVSENDDADPDSGMPATMSLHHQVAEGVSVHDHTLPPGCDTPGAYLTWEEQQLQAHSREVYEQRLALGVAREQARKDLPLSTYTEAYWKIDLHNLFHFLGKRMDPAAQLEIRSYANIIGEQIVAKLFPESWQAFLDYRLNAMTLSALEVEQLKRSIDQLFDYSRVNAHPGMTEREQKEFRAKLERLYA